MTARARFSWLARILLTSRQSLARYAAALFVVSQISACVLPIAPEFQDPPASPNYAPRIITTIPPQGSIVTGSASASTTFTATVTDPNLGDRMLHTRWLADFPPQGPNTRTLTLNIDVSNLATGTDVTQTVSCQSLLAPVPEHPITVIVADRPFDDTKTDLTALADPTGFTVQATWFLKLDCTVP